MRGVNWLGDAIMTTPALCRLREALPSAHICLLSPRKLTELWSGHPAVDSTIETSSDTSLWTVARQLRQQRFDLGIIFPNSSRAALELWLGNVPVRVGLRGNWRQGLLSHVVEPRQGQVAMRKQTVAGVRQAVAGSGSQPLLPVLEEEAHHLHHYLHLVAAVGANPAPVRPRIEVSGAETAAMALRLGRTSESNAGPPLFGLNPGAEYGPAKRWPVERFASAATELHRRARCDFVIFGSDQGLALQLETKIRQSAEGSRGGTQGAIWNLAGKTTLRELCAGLKACQAVLTNDTGPMHLAAAVGTPVVVPFGSTSPELTGPGLPRDPRHRLLRGQAACAPCFLRECPIDFRCMHSITVDLVVQAMLDASGCA